MLQPKYLTTCLADGAGPPPLPASAVEYWISEIQCTPSAWVGQLKGSSLAGGNTPTVAADPGYCNGRIAAQTTAATSKSWVNRSLPALLANGSRPCSYSVGRWRTVGIADVLMVSHGGSLAASGIQQVAGAKTSFVFSGGAAQVDGPAADTAAHRHIGWADGALANFQIDKTLYTTAYTGALGEASTMFAVGELSRTAYYWADASVWFWLLCSSKPSAAELYALDVWSYRRYGLVLL